MLRRGRLIEIAGLCMFLLSGDAWAQDVNERYPPRLPDWLWQDGPLTPLLDPDNADDLKIEIKREEALRAAGRRQP